MLEDRSLSTPLLSGKAPARFRSPIDNYCIWLSPERSNCQVERAVLLEIDLLEVLNLRDVRIDGRRNAF